VAPYGSGTGRSQFKIEHLGKKSKEFYRVKGSGLSMRPVPGSTKQSEQIFRKRGTEILVVDLVCEPTLAGFSPERCYARAC